MTPLDALDPDAEKTVERYPLSDGVDRGEIEDGPFPQLTMVPADDGANPAPIDRSIVERMRSRFVGRRVFESAQIVLGIVFVVGFVITERSVYGNHHLLRTTGLQMVST